MNDVDREASGAPSLYFPERLPAASEGPVDPYRATRYRGTVVAAIALAVVVVGVAVVLSLQTWNGTGMTPLARAVLGINLLGGVAPMVVYGLAAVALVVLAVRRPTRGVVVRSLLGAGVGALAAVALLWYLLGTNALGVGLSATTMAWGIVGFAAIGFAISALVRSAPWRKLVAVVAAVLFAASAYLGINADFGLDRTVADVAGVSLQGPIALPTHVPHPSATPTSLAGGALWANWRPPAGMPSVGRQGQVTIPNTLSHFSARPAGLYLPPAALVANAPALPLVIMMMGQPGNPDPSFSAAVLDRFAAQHQGLAPIVLVPDQIGNPAVDPMCLNTARHGNAETYIVQDVVAWARANLHVMPDPAHWTIAGYSNGGQCALSFGVKYPQIWGNVLDISGEAYPGADRPAKTLATEFHGDRAAYEAVKPLNLLAGRKYPDTVGIFTVGSDDALYRSQAKAVYAATTAAGWKTTYFEVPNGGHVLGALNGGLQEGYTVLYPRLGLAKP